MRRSVDSGCKDKIMLFCKILHSFVCFLVVCCLSKPQIYRRFVKDHPVTRVLKGEKAKAWAGPICFGRWYSAKMKIRGFERCNMVVYRRFSGWFQTVCESGVDQISRPDAFQTWMRQRKTEQRNSTAESRSRRELPSMAANNQNGGFVSTNNVRTVQRLPVMIS